jgi:hypothetical protein
MPMHDLVIGKRTFIVDCEHAYYVPPRGPMSEIIGRVYFEGLRNVSLQSLVGTHVAVSAIGHHFNKAHIIVKGSDTLIIVGVF